MATPSSEIFDNLADRFSLSSIRDMAGEYYSDFTGFCSPLQIAVVLLIVHVVHRLYKRYQGKQFVLMDELKPLLILIAVIGITYYFCANGAVSYAWLSLIIYLVIVWIYTDQSAEISLSNLQSKILAISQVNGMTAVAVPVAPVVSAAPAVAAPADAASASPSVEQPFDPYASNYGSF